MDNNTNYTVKVTGPGLNLEQEITPGQVSRLISIIISPSAVSSQTQDDETSKIFPEISVGEFLSEKKPQTNPEKILVFAKYLMTYEKYKFVSLEDIKHSFEEALEPVPKNFNRDFRAVMKNSWFTESSTEPGRYLITNTGLRRLEEPFARSVKINRTSNVKSQRRSQKTVLIIPIREEIDNLKINDEDQEEFVGINKKGDKILWILSFARVNNINQLNTKEIENLSTRLGGKIQAKDVHVLIQNYKKNNFVLVLEEKGYKEFKISNSGLELVNKIKN